MNWKLTLDKPITDYRSWIIFRGGGSFLGELFNHNTKAFYRFEPLRNQAYRGGYGNAQGETVIANRYIKLQNNTLR